MKPWREVLAERGWKLTRLRLSDYEWWEANCGGERWEVMIARGSDGARLSVWRDGHCFEELDGLHSDDAAAFSALMAKPIGPGRVTVGALLGVEDALHV